MLKKTELKWHNYERYKQNIFILFCFFFFFVLIFTSEAEVYTDKDHIWANNNITLSNLIFVGNDSFEIKDKICYLKKPLHITENITLFATGDSCLGLRMYPDTYIRVAGSVFFKDIFVTSYDPETNDHIYLTRDEYDKTRPYIYTKSPSRMFSAINTEFSYLGYYKLEQNGSKWGVALYDLPNGEVKNSSIHHNYFGLYTFQTKNLVVENSKIYSNLEYGLDFHDYSDNFLIYRNEVYDNGNHAIIFSKWCDYNKIIENNVHDNMDNVFVKGNEKDYGTHGIMLHHSSNYNLVQGNNLTNNRVGIYLMDSDYNTISDNQIFTDREEGIYLLDGDNNLISNNSVFSSEGYSLYSYYSSKNTYKNNYFKNYAYIKDQDGSNLYMLNDVPGFIYDYNNTIYINADLNLIDLNLINDSIDINNRNCYIKESLFIKQKASFTFNNDDCDIILLYPNVSIISMGSLYFYNVKVTSYDSYTNMPIFYDENDVKKNARPYIYSYGNFTSKDSSFLQLGYDENKSGIFIDGLNKFDALNKVFIYNSSFENNFVGILIKNAHNVLINSSFITKSKENGVVFLDNCVNNVIYKNVITENKGSAILFGKNCSTNKIVENTISGKHFATQLQNDTQKEYGIYLKSDSYGNEISSNSIKDDFVGIFIQQGNSNNVSKNNFEKYSTYAILINGGKNNIVKGNFANETGKNAIKANYTDNIVIDNTFQENSLKNIRFDVNKVNDVRNENNKINSSFFIWNIPKKLLDEPKFIIILLIMMIASIIFVVELFVLRGRK
jgi:parallel beta-helix repeat protein